MIKAGAATVGTTALIRSPAAQAADPMAMRVVKAAHSDALVDMCGVRLNMWAANSSMYGDVSVVLDALRDDSVGLGLRHVRERMILPAENHTMALNQQRSWPRIAALGIDFTCMIGAVDNSEGTVRNYADYIKKQFDGSRGIVTTVENGNEPNAPSRTWNAHNPNGWVRLCRKRQRRMAAVFRHDPHLAGINLAGPSLVGGAALLKYRQLGDLSRHIDVGNFHLYAGTHKKSTPSAELDGTLAGVAINAPGKPTICTETGMNNAVNAKHQMAYHPEHVAGVYMPRVPLEYFYRGVNRVLSFELLDCHANPRLNNATDHFGLLRYSTSGMVRKPAYKSFKRLLDLLRDPGPHFSAGGLAMEVSHRPATYRHVLFQKRDGTFYLCMWLDVSIWDQVNNTKIRVAPHHIRLDLRTPATIKLYEPGTQTASKATYHHAKTVRVALGGGVCVLEIS